MDWVRGQSIGHGNFGRVSLAIPKNRRAGNLPPLMAVKSCGASSSAVLRHEKDLLTLIGADCPRIVRCFGDCLSHENGEHLYNVFLEFAHGGSLADRVRNPGGGGLPICEVRRYTRSILEGLSHIHGRGFVHCDLKLSNILVCASEKGGKDDVKIADFGLSERAGERRGFEIRGTPMSLSPESVSRGEYEPPADVWALGCAVAEMATGTPPWRCVGPEADVARLLFRIGGGQESPEIPDVLPEDGKDFLARCFVRDPKQRWTAGMLLRHPFVVDVDEDAAATAAPEELKEGEPSTSPRGPLDLPGWAVRDDDRLLCFSSSGLQSPDSHAQYEEGRCPTLCSASTRPPAHRIRHVATGDKPDWSISDGWVTVR